MQPTTAIHLCKKTLYLLTAAGGLGVSSFAQQQPLELAFNLADPSKLVILGNGEFLAVQAGTRPNRGTLYLFDSQGDFTPVLVGLPGSGKNVWPPAPTAPDGLAAYGNTLYVARGR
jgi:hypothetical protein